MDKYIIAQDYWADPGYGDNSTYQENYDRYTTSSSSDTPPTLGALFRSFDGLTDYLLPVGILLAIVMVIVGGYMWMSSAGNPDKVKQAQGTLTWAVIGIVFIAIIGLLVKLLVDSIVAL